MEFDEDEREVKTVESAQEANATGTSRVFMCTASDFIGCESEQIDSDDCSGNDADLSSEARPEDTEGIEEIIPAVNQAQGSSYYTTMDGSCHSQCCSEGSDVDKPFQPSTNYAVFSKKTREEHSTFKVSWYTSFN